MLAFISTGHGCQGLGIGPSWLHLHNVKIVKKDATAPILTLGSEARTKRKGKRTKTEPILADVSSILGSFHRSSISISMSFNRTESMLFLSARKVRKCKILRVLRAYTKLEIG